jgi:hypothetical protein
MDLFPWPWPYDYSPGAQWEIEPQGIYANSTLRFIKILQCFPASLWTLQYGLVPYAGKISGPITFSSAPFNSTDIHLVDLDAAVTGAWAPGRYTWQCFAQASGANTDLTDRFFVSTGTIAVFADLTAAGSLDTRGKWQVILDEVDQLILDTAGDVYQEIAIGRGTIAGQNIKAWTRKDLLEFRDYALHMAGNEQRIRDRRGGAPNPRLKYATMGAGGNGIGYNGFPSFPPFG